MIAHKFGPLESLAGATDVDLYEILLQAFSSGVMTVAYDISKSEAAAGEVVDTVISKIDDDPALRAALIAIARLSIDGKQPEGPL